MVPRQRAHPLLFGLTAGMPTAQLRERDAHSGRVSGVVKPGEALAQVGTTQENRCKLLKVRPAGSRGCWKQHHVMPVRQLRASARRRVSLS